MINNNDIELDFYVADSHDCWPKKWYTIWRVNYVPAKGDMVEFRDKEGKQAFLGSVVERWWTVAWQYEEMAVAILLKEEYR